MSLQSTNVTLERAGQSRLCFPDLRLDRGGSVLLLGPSGCGKTTLLSILAGLLTPTSGQVIFDGDDLYTMPGARRDRFRGQNFGFIFQTLHLLPSLTLRQNIALASTMIHQPVDQARLDHLLGTLGLDTLAGRKPAALSQGEQQRGAIARALLNRPAVIIADEPTSALDDRNAEITINLLLQQAAECNAALLVATHDTRIRASFQTMIELDPSSMRRAA